MNIAEMRRKLTELKAQAKALMDKAGAEKRDLLDEERSQIDALIAQAEALEADIRRAEKIEGFTDPTMPPGDERRAPAFHRRPTKDTASSLMCRYIRSGGRDWLAAEEMNQASLEEYRAGDRQIETELGLGLAEERASNDTSMNIATSADGGNLVPVGHYNRIIERKDKAGLAAALPLRPIPGLGTTVDVPTDDEADGEFVVTAEQTDNHTNNFDRDAPAVGKQQMTLVKYTKKIELTDELQLDNDSNLMQYLEYRVGLGLRKTDDNLIVTEALANGTAALTFDSPTAIGAKEIPELVYLQADGYEEGSAWIMRRATYGHIKSLDGDAWKFVSTPNGRELWDFSVHTTGKMPAIQASAKSTIFGNFEFMGVRRLPGLTLLVDPYTVDGMVVLKYYYRVVFKVLQAAAIIYGTHPSA